MKIEVGNYELLFSGFVIQIKDNPIIIKFPDEIEGDFTLTLEFITDTTKKESRTELIPLNKFELKVNLINCKGFMGGGNTELMYLGTYKHFPFYFNYRVFDLHNVSSTIIYNFYIGKEVQNA